MKRYGPAVVLALLALSGTLPAYAATTPPSGTPTPPTTAPITAPVPQGINISATERYVAQGVTLTTYERIEPLGWVEAHVLTVDLSQQGVKTDLLWSGAAADRNTVGNLVQSTGAIAGINADYFDTAVVTPSLSGAMGGGALVSTGTTPDWTNLAGVGIDRLGGLTTLALAAEIKSPLGARKIERLNQQLLTNEIGIFTAAWGTTERRNAAIWGKPIKEVQIKGGKVVAVADEAGQGAIPADTLILLGRDEGATWLNGLKVGDPVQVTWAPKTGDGRPYQFLVGGNKILVRGGQVVATDDKALEPRSAIGFSADAKRMYLVAVDGRSGRSRGMTHLGLAYFMKQLGADSALNLDGGGSSTLVAKPAGSGSASLINTPSDGVQRTIANGVGVWVVPGSGQVKRLEIAATAERVFPGLTRRLTVGAWDESGSTVDTAIALSTSAGQVTGERFRAPDSGGSVTLRATAGALTVSKAIRVLGPLQSLHADQPKLALTGAPAILTLLGQDDAGFTAPIDGEDAALSYDASRLQVATLPDGRLQVTPLQPAFTTWLTAVVQGKLLMVQVVSGSNSQSLNHFNKLENWKTSVVPVGSPVTTKASPGYLSPGIELTYDFTTSTDTRAAYLLPASTLTLPGRPDRIGLWVKGDGTSTWLRMVLLDATGKKLTLDLARHVDWSDWRFVEAAIPVGLNYPLTLQQIYPVETPGPNQYKGALTFSDLKLSTAVGGWQGSTALAAALDPTIVANGELPAGGLRFAFLPKNASMELRRKALAAGAQVLFTADATPALEPVTPGVKPDSPVASVASLDRQGSRFLLLNANLGSLRASGFEQLASLQSALKAAETAPVQQVILLVNQELGSWTEKREADLIRSWLADFRLRSGKGAALIGQGGSTAGAIRFEGARIVNLPGGTNWYLGRLEAGATEWLQMAPRS